MAKARKTTQRKKPAGNSKAGKRGKSASHSRRTNGRVQEITSTHTFHGAVLTTTETSLSLDGIRAAVRSELAEAMLAVVRVLTARHSAVADSGIRHHGDLPRAVQDSVVISERFEATNGSGVHGIRDEHIKDAREELPEEPRLPERLSAHPANDRDAADKEAIDAQARGMFATIEARSQMQSACSPLQIVNFMIERKAFGPDTAVKTKDLPKARSTKRSASRNFLEELGALEPVRVTPVRPRKQGTQRPSRRRVDGVFLTPLAVRGWELRYGAAVVHN